MHVRRFSVLTLVTVAAGLALTACNDETTGGASSSAADSSVTASADPGVRCTDQLDYSGDPRSNAEINSIGAETGECPEPEGEGAGSDGAGSGDAASGGTASDGSSDGAAIDGSASDGAGSDGAGSDGAAEAGVRCTDQLNYAGDPRSNAEINSIGAETGECPEPEGEGAAEGTPAEPGVSCTNQLNYAGDPRSNAEINSIGEETGYCPPVLVP
ncbi:hypothetical protein [Streptomyces hoynatensis]|uniref:Secreted protein n=1 Tax=Streptomyces hoynatensis TaxID=1141874 RepID=A0A3A9ZER0_9ACTN|nr:hypothetical protein [Streptomyces hoynatensis]RKN45746.1 hypothetical protein D7294_04610 [Streptomyces hoynatensis]